MTTDRTLRHHITGHHRGPCAHGHTTSMARIAAAGDNAAVESSFALLQKNVLNRRTWHTRDELHLAIVT